MSSNLDREYGQQSPTPGLFTAARHHPLVVLAAVAAGILLAALATLALPVKYTAQARLALGDESDSTVFKNVTGLNPTAKAQQAADVMRSPQIYDRASALLGGKLSAKDIQDNVQVAPGDNNPSVTITGTWDNPNRAANIANAVGQAYLDNEKDQEQARGDRARNALKALQTETLSQIDAINEQISERVDKIRRKAAETIATPGDRSRFVQNQLNTDPKYIALTSQADRLNANLSEVREKLLESRVDSELVSAGVDSLYKAEQPNHATSPNLKRNLLVGAAIGLLVGLAIAWRRFDKRRGLDKEEVEAVLAAPMLGRVPDRRALRQSSHLADLAKHSDLSDDLRGLASTLMLHCQRADFGGAVVTSAEPGEGKTVVALNLAAAAHVDGHDVVLVDGDVRHPDLTEALGLSSYTGLRNLMAGPAAAQYGELPVPGGGSVPVLPVGTRVMGYPPGAPLPQLPGRSDGQRAAIVDSPSVSDDPTAIALASDGRAGLVVVVSPVATAEDLARLRARADLAGAPIVGFVVNEHRPRTSRWHRSGEEARPRGKRIAVPARPAPEPESDEQPPLTTAVGQDQRS